MFSWGRCWLQESHVLILMSSYLYWWYFQKDVLLSKEKCAYSVPIQMLDWEQISVSNYTKQNKTKQNKNYVAVFASISNYRLKNITSTINEWALF